MNLSEDSIKWALTHLKNIGDSDLFPWAAEIEALLAMEAEVTTLLTTKPIGEFRHGSARRFMVPKDDVSFRRATQLAPFDSLILTGLIHQFGNGIEKRRIPTEQKIVFSNRFTPQPDGWLYAKNQDWNSFWSECYQTSKKFNCALVLDISDFYNQIYHHTIENQLIESGFPNQAVKWIIGLLETLTAKVSRGLPVGPHAAHLLAESSLIPIDNALQSRGVPFRRYVDDIVVFGGSQLECRKHLNIIADILDKQQRLILNKTKTRLLVAADFQKYCSGMIEDRPINILESELLSVILKYSGGNPYATILLSKVTAEDLALFTQDSVERILSEYLSKTPVDFIRLRWFLRRLTQVGHSGGVSFCLDHLEEMTPALADVCHYFLSVALSGASDISSIALRLLKALEVELIRVNEYFRLCILSLFTRNGAFNHFSKLLEYFEQGSPNLQREVILAARLGHHGDWLRELKERAPGMDDWSRSAFLLAAKHLPLEERRFYAKAWSGRSELEDILIKWVKTP